MEGHTSSAPYNMALDNIDPSEIEQMLQQIRWEQSIGQQSFASSEYDTAHFDLTLSPLSGVHTNKHTKPFRCTAEGCDYATAEKKSLQRHLLARSKWDEEHRAAAQSEGVRQVRHRCPRPGCTYATVREDNLKRHISTCAQ
ncbi:putative c2h2 transcription [Diaporthe ampelina]|uniref:Putative c2h2 transcription n=1 Tax=Diaporthe ampelina TaxID=1214573 RepID=A0A0G2FY63_9PEZI|nr:putative c2h2 transcription [Diaporthe ampelina]